MKTHAISAAPQTIGGLDILTRRETSAQTRLSVETLKRYEKTGRLTPIRVGPKLIRYRAAEVLALLK